MSTSTLPKLSRYTCDKGYPGDASALAVHTFGTEGYTFTAPGHTAADAPGTRYAVFQVNDVLPGPVWHWVVADVDGQRRRIGQPQDTRKAAIASALGAIDARRSNHADRTAEERAAIGEGSAGNSAPDGPDTRSQLTRAQRAAAWRMAEDQDQAPAPVAPVTTAWWEHDQGARRARIEEEDQAAAQARTLDLARQSEERNRPVRASVYVSRMSGRAVLRLHGADGGDFCDPIALDGVHAGPIQAGADAVDVIAKRGFRTASGAYWTKSRERLDVATLDVVPTRAYLAYVDRRFGPLPEIPAVDGATITPRVQRGWWDVTTADGQALALTWSPRIGGDRWVVWGGPDLSDLVRSTTDLGKALFVVRHPSHVRA
ncbi:hypothetical protein ACF064_01525 [Streptomyces sp. NPDC015492]|uniref:hypothetical protein n=1 Tax=Streptomyces sp. NPDC015492 TaxID=3364958 RepID=UPI0036F4D4AA